MSLPKHTASPSPLSSSPHKYPFRGNPTRTPSGRTTTTDRHSSEQQRQHQHYEEQTENALPYDGDEHRDYENEDGERRYHDVDEHTHMDPEMDHNPSSPSSFQPFFTIIEDTNTSEYYHPTVHYIFSDDDTDIVTEAALRALETNQQDNQNQNPKRPETHRHRHTQSGEDGVVDGEEGEEQKHTYEEDGDTSPQKPSLLPRPIPGIRENYIILDIEPSSSSSSFEIAAAAGADSTATPASNTNNIPGKIGTGGSGTKSMSTSPATVTATVLPHQQQQFKITSAHSLTPTWQVLDTQLLPAPTFENNAPDDEQGHGHGQQHGLMLKIHGSAGLPPSSLVGRDRGSPRLEEMMDQFAKRMGELRRVIEAGEQMGGGGVGGADGVVRESGPETGTGTDTLERPVRGGDEDARGP